MGYPVRQGRGVGTPGRKFRFGNNQKVKVDVIVQERPQTLPNTIGLSLAALFQDDTNIYIALICGYAPGMGAEEKDGLGPILPGENIPDGCEGGFDMARYSRRTIAGTIFSGVCGSFAGVPVPS